MADSPESDFPDPAASVADDAVSAPFSAPSPAEVLMMIGRSLSPRWRQSYRPSGNAPPVEREQAALALGVIGTELLLAIQARDEQHAAQILSDTAAIEKTLGVAETLRSRRQRLQGHATANQWDACRRETEALRDEQVAALISQRDGDLATLVPVGGWLRTMEIEAGLSAEAKLPLPSLRATNPPFLDWLDAQLNELSTPAQATRSVARCRQVAERVRRLCGGGEPETRHHPAILEMLRDTINRITTP